MSKRHAGGIARLRGSPIETADGTTLFTRDWGEGPPLVSLSGWGLCSDVWAYQMAPLSECELYDGRRIRESSFVLGWQQGV